MKHGAARSIAIFLTVASIIAPGLSLSAKPQDPSPPSVPPPQTSRNAPPGPVTQGSAQYQQLQKRLASGWNTWDVHSVTTQVLLPDGLAIHVGLKHNSTEFQDAFLGDALIGRLTPGAEQVFPGPHSWEGSYTDLRLSWKGHILRLQTAHDGSNLVMLATPLPSQPLSRGSWHHCLFCELSLEPPWDCNQAVKSNRSPRPAPFRHGLLHL